MNKLKYTPGPWEIDPKAKCHVVSESGRGICSTGSHFDSTAVDGGESENQANAQLVSASPDLLKALEAALEWIDAVPTDAQLPTMPGIDRDWINSVIQKAKGC